MARKTKTEVLEVVQELTSLVETGEILNYTEEELENRFSMTRKTLRGYLSEIKGNIGSRDIKFITLRLNNIMNEIMDDIEKLWRTAKEDKNEQRIVYYSKQMFFAIEKFVDFLERFGRKEKVADKVDARVLVINAEVDVSSLSKELLGE